MREPVGRVNRIGKQLLLPRLQRQPAHFDGVSRRDGRPRAERHADFNVLARPLAHFEPLQPGFHLAARLVQLLGDLTAVHFVQPRLAVAHARGRLLHLRRALAVPLNGRAEPRLLGSVLFVFKFLMGAAALEFRAIGAVIAGKVGELRILNVQYARAERVEQFPVVRYEHHCAAILLEFPPELRDALGVQIGRRLVREQKLAVCRQRRRNAPPRALAAGKPFAALLRGELCAERRIVQSVRVAHLMDHSNRAIAAHCALVGHNFAREDAEQRRFARAIFSDQADALAIVDAQGVDLEHPAQAEAMADAGGLEQNSGHKKSLLPPWRSAQKELFRRTAAMRPPNGNNESAVLRGQPNRVGRISVADIH